MFSSHVRLGEWEVKLSAISSSSIVKPATIMAENCAKAGGHENQENQI